MPLTPDRHPGPLLEEEIILEPTTDPTTEGAIRYVSGVGFRAKDVSGVFTLGSGGGGDHGTLDTLLHNLDESCYLQFVRTGQRVTSVIAWTTVGMTLKVRELLLTYISGKVSTYVFKQYNAAGSLVETLTHTIARTGQRVSSITVVKT